MPVDVRWYNDAQTILLVHYSERWTWEEYAAAFDEAKGMIESVAHDVFVVQYSDTGFKALPLGAALPHMKYVSERRPKNMVKSFIVIEAELARNFIAMMIGVLPANRERQPNIFVASIEEALAQIAETPAG